MQYSPQSSRQEQVPEQAEATPIAGEPAAGKQELKRLRVYANRIQAARSMSRMTNRMIMTLLFLVPISLVILDTLKNTYPNGPATLFIMGIIVLLELFVLARTILDHWLIGRALLANPEPLLHFTNAGLWIRGSHWPTSIFLAWNEIEAIEIYRYKWHYLCVRPRNPQLVYARFPQVERLLNTGVNLFYGEPPLTLYLAYLDRPVEEILQELYSVYAQELNAHQVQIRS